MPFGYKLSLKKDKTIKKKDYYNKETPKNKIDNLKQEYKFDKNTDLIPKKCNKLICIMFTDDKGRYFLARKINTKKNFFRFRKGRYIIDNEAIQLTRNVNRI
jgi:hypothetical protein